MVHPLLPSPPAPTFSLSSIAPSLFPLPLEAVGNRSLCGRAGPGQGPHRTRSRWVRPGRTERASEASDSRIYQYLYII